MKRIIGALVLAAGLFAAAPALSAQASADTGPSVPSCDSASAPAATPNASSGAGGAAGGAQAPTPGLPVTGSGAVYWAAGAGAVLVGGGLFLVARRRRVKFSS
jgi:LPXTG-motif cell wall-anchored protein